MRGRADDWYATYAGWTSLSASSLIGPVASTLKTDGSGNGKLREVDATLALAGVGVDGEVSLSASMVVSKVGLAVGEGGDDAGSPQDHSSFHCPFAARREAIV